MRNHHRCLRLSLLPLLPLLFIGGCYDSSQETERTVSSRTTEKATSLLRAEHEPSASEGQLLDTSSHQEVAADHDGDSLRESGAQAIAEQAPESQVQMAYFLADSLTAALDIQKQLDQSKRAEAPPTVSRSSNEPRRAPALQTVIELLDRPQLSSAENSAAEAAWTQSAGRILAEAQQIRSVALLQVGMGGDAIYEGVDTSLDHNSNELALAPEFRTQWKSAVEALIGARTPIFTKAVTFNIQAKQLKEQIGITGNPIMMSFMHGRLVYDTIQADEEYIDAVLNLYGIGNQNYAGVERGVTLHRSDMNELQRNGRNLYGPLRGLFYEIRRGQAVNYFSATILTDLERKSEQERTRVAQIEAAWAQQWRGKVSLWSLLTAIQNNQGSQDAELLISATESLLLHVAREHATQVRAKMAQRSSEAMAVDSKSTNKSTDPVSIEGASRNLAARSRTYREALKSIYSSADKSENLRHTTSDEPDWAEEAWEDWSRNFPTLARNANYQRITEQRPLEASIARQLQSGISPPSPGTLRASARIVDELEAVLTWESLEVPRVDWVDLDDFAITTEKLRQKLANELRALRDKKPWDGPRAFQTLAESTANAGESKVANCIQRYAWNARGYLRGEKIIDSELESLSELSNELGQFQRVLKESLKIAPKLDVDAQETCRQFLASSGLTYGTRQAALNKLLDRARSDQQRIEHAIEMLRSREELKTELAEWNRLVISQIEAAVRDVVRALREQDHASRAPIRTFIAHLDAAPKNLEDHPELIQHFEEFSKRNEVFLKEQGRIGSVVEALSAVERAIPAALKRAIPDSYPADVQLQTSLSDIIPNEVGDKTAPVGPSDALSKLSEQIKASHRLQGIKVRREASPWQGGYQGGLRKGEQYRDSVTTKMVHFGPRHRSVPFTGPTLTQIRFAKCKDGEERILYLFAEPSDGLFSPNWWKYAFKRWRCLEDDKWRRLGGSGPFLDGPGPGAALGAWRRVQVPARFLSK